MKKSWFLLLTMYFASISLFGQSGNYFSDSKDHIFARKSLSEKTQFKNQGGKKFENDFFSSSFNCLDFTAYSLKKPEINQSKKNNEDAFKEFVSEQVKNREGQIIPQNGKAARIVTNLNKETTNYLLDSIIEESYNEEYNKWWGYGKMIYSYDIYGNCSQVLFYSLDDSTLLLTPDRKIEYFYGKDPEFKQQIGLIWDIELGKWVNFVRYEYTFNESGNETMIALYSWNESAKMWFGRFKTEIQYDPNDNVTSFSQCEWDTISLNWRNGIKEEVQYDENGNIKGYSVNIWDISKNKWIVYFQEVIIFDINGNEISSTEYQRDTITGLLVNVYKNERVINGDLVINTSYDWNNQTNKWIEIWKDQYITFVNGNETLYINNVWDYEEGIWKPASKVYYSTDEKGNEILYINYFWDKKTEKWIGSDKQEKAFDLYGNEILNIEYDWDTITNDWISNYKGEFVYDNKGNNLLSVQYIWNTEVGKWSGIVKFETTYNSDGEPIRNIEYNWDENTSQWVNCWKYEMVYDENGNNRLSFNSYWDETKLKWIDENRETSYYSVHNITNITNGRLKTCKVYMSKTENTIIVEMPDSYTKLQIELYDLQGRKVLSRQLSSNVQVQTGYLSNGLYIYNIIADNQIFTGKVLLK